MRALFGCGLHPLAETRLQQLDGPNLTREDVRDVMRLGTPFKIIDDATPFRVEVARRIAALNGLIGEPVDASVDALLARPGRCRGDGNTGRSAAAGPAGNVRCSVAAPPSPRFPSQHARFFDAVWC
jgi:hypothetical protein